jgi:hypothetical protein
MTEIAEFQTTRELAGVRKPLRNWTHGGETRLKFLNKFLTLSLREP